MVFRAFVLLPLLLVCSSVLAREIPDHDATKPDVVHKDIKGMFVVRLCIMLVLCEHCTSLCAQ